jgi:hypothetical protein
MENGGRCWEDGGTDGTERMVGRAGNIVGVWWQELGRAGRCQDFIHEELGDERAGRTLQEIGGYLLGAAVGLLKQARFWGHTPTMGTVMGSILAGTPPQTEQAWLDALSAETSALVRTRSV